MTIKPTEAPETITLVAEGKTVGVIAAPSGFSIHSVKSHFDEYLDAPEYIKGIATLTHLDSFIAHANAFKTATSAVFARDAAQNNGGASLTVIYDYHKAGDPAFCYHKAHYKLEVSKEWARWTAATAEPMSQDTLAAFIEDNALDLLDPPTLTFSTEIPLSEADQRLLALSQVFATGYSTVAKLLEVARGVEIVERSRVSTGVNTSTGERTAEYMATHTDADKRPGIPGLFLIAIPVFKNGALYRLPVRLKYQKIQSEVVWSFELYRADQAFDAAVEDVVVKVKEETSLPVYFGSAEG